MTVILFVFRRVSVDVNGEESRLDLIGEDAFKIKKMYTFKKSIGR